MTGPKLEGRIVHATASHGSSIIFAHDGSSGHSVIYVENIELRKHLDNLTSAANDCVSILNENDRAEIEEMLLLLRAEMAKAEPRHDAAKPLVSRLLEFLERTASSALGGAAVVAAKLYFGIP